MGGSGEGGGGEGGGGEVRSRNQGKANIRTRTALLCLDM